MIILCTSYVYYMARVGVGSLKVQLKSSIILHKFIVLGANGETKHLINNLILKQIYRESEIHNIINQKSIKHYKYNILRNKRNTLSIIYIFIVI